MTQLEELTKIIADIRWEREEDMFIPSEEIAKQILESGFVKKPITVTRRMIHNSLLKFYPAISIVQEVISTEKDVEQRMAEAIYAAWATWKQEGE